MPAWYYILRSLRYRQCIDNYRRWKKKNKLKRSDDAIIQLFMKLFLNYRYYNAYLEIQTKFYYQKTRFRIMLLRRKWPFRSVIPENYINYNYNYNKLFNTIQKRMHCVETVYLWCQYALGQSFFFQKYERKNLEFFAWSWENDFVDLCPSLIEKIGFPFFKKNWPHFRET